MPRLSRKIFLPILLFVIYFTAFSLFVDPVQAEESVYTYTRVYGSVFDSKTRLPIPDAYVIFAYRYGSSYRRWSEAETDALGSYEVLVRTTTPLGSYYTRSYWVYAYCDLPSTEGFDYVPARQWISLGEASLNISFVLLPGASVHAVGDLTLFGSEPVQTIFTVIGPSGFLKETNSVTEYTRPVNDLLSLNRRTIVVPSDTPVKVRVDMIYPMLELQLTIDMEGDYLNLTQGTQFIVNLRNLIVRGAVDYARARLQFVQAMVEEAEGVGFYVTYERIKLNRAENLMEAVQSALAEGNYDLAHADSHETYLILRDLESSLLSMYVNASESVFFITPLLGVTAIALAFVLSESPRQRLALSLFLYGVLFGFLYLLYPSYNALQRRIYGLWASTALSVLIPTVLVVVSFLAAYYVILRLPQALKEGTSMEGLRLLSAMVAAFSLAARNLMRRRLRTLLTSALMLTSVFAFITLTSFSFEYEFRVQQQPGQAPSEGFLLRKPLGDFGESEPFKPVEEKILQWLEESPEAALVVPIIENTPKVGIDGPPLPLTTIYANGSSLSFDVSGVLGVFPDLEAKVTKMDSIVVRGRFLSDEEVDGILLSEKAAEELQVEPNDTLTLYNRTFHVTGIFDIGKLDVLKDLDGLPLSPQYVIMITHGDAPPGYMFIYVPGQEVVIMHGETAQSLPEMVVSRIDVQTGNPQEIMDFARLAVLTWPEVETFASVAGDIHRLFIGHRYIVTGFVSAVVPLVLVILNVGVMMLGAVYERKREVAIMSCVGLNPLHVTAVFVAEALVMGIVAGSLGYALGLIGYRFMAMFLVPLGVKQKVEAIWGILALCFSIAAGVLGSALPARMASVITTPSMLRKFVITLEEKPRTPREPWRLNIPLQLRREDLWGFFNFVYERLQGYNSRSVERIENLRAYKEEAAEPTTFSLSFTYIYTEEGVVTENQLSPVESRLPNRYIIQLASKTRRGTIMPQDEAGIHRTAGFIRHLLFQWGYEYKSLDSQRPQPLTEGELHLNESGPSGRTASHGFSNLLSSRLKFFARNAW